MQTNHLGAFDSPERLGPCAGPPALSSPMSLKPFPRITKHRTTWTCTPYRKTMSICRSRYSVATHLKAVTWAIRPLPAFWMTRSTIGKLLKSRVSIYHGKSRYQVHYHPIEFMALGVPVLFHENSAYAAEGLMAGMTRQTVAGCWHVSDVSHANDMAKSALQDASVAQEWSDRQRIFMEECSFAKKFHDQARWLKSRVIQLRNWYAAHPDQLHRAESVTAAAIAAPAPEPVVKIRRPMPVRIYRELKRALRKTLRTA